jgi:hypothetical protein
MLGGQQGKNATPSVTTRRHKGGQQHVPTGTSGLGPAIGTPDSMIDHQLQ